MVTPVKTTAKVVTDDTGISYMLPVLVTESGVLTPLLDYLLSRHHDRSASWAERVVHATYLLMQYMEANKHSFSDPKLLFESFAQRLYTGTINDYGNDPSGLYWLPTSTKTANGLIVSLTGLTDYVAFSLGRQPINPITQSSTFEQRLNYAAWFRRTQHDFLGHIQDKSVSTIINQARLIKGRRSQVTVHDDAIGFPERLFSQFFRDGIGDSKDVRVSVRNQLILLMMHFAGCRVSDALHLWVEDVFFDPNIKDSAIVRLYHPEDGKAPGNWKSRSGLTNRAAFLREQYSLTPRNRLIGTKKVGWKNQVVDHRDNYIQLHWFPSQAGVLFQALWCKYIRYLAVLDREHPYAFVSFEEANLGQPLTINSFYDAYKKALLRINLRPSKPEGLSPHAHRHAMGRRLENANVHPRIIQKVLHHRSLGSQEPYTAPSIERVTASLSHAMASLESGNAPSSTKNTYLDWQALIEQGWNSNF